LYQIQVWEVNLFVSSLDNKKFEIYFEKIYSGRWQALKKALTYPEKQILRPNLFFKTDTNKLQPCDFLPNCYWRPEDYRLEKNDQGLYPFYIMDPASLIVAMALEVQSTDQVLDMCAAPGGKTLILAERISDDGQLISNEMSDSRRERLTRVLHEYIPRENRNYIFVKGLDGNQYGLRQPETFDRILADVPCSGERHLLENNKELSLWTEKRTQNLAVRQYSLLSSAWLALKEGGRIVYSTCSISPKENDDVIAKLIKKREPHVLRPLWLEKFDFLEKTEHGYQILPDRCGFGPMYFSVIQKGE
jgi:5-methylcytosine rRNA methyltransferase NSUN4